MKKICENAFILLMLLNGSQLLAQEDISTERVFFQENKGQICDQNYNSRPDVLFSGSANGLNYHLTKTGISYQLSKVERWREITEQKNNTKLKIAGSTSIYRVDINWLGTNNNVEIEKGNALEGTTNYYLQQCPNGVLGVKSYGNLTYKDIYKGIDLKWYEKNGNLEYDFIVSPGANVSQIKLQINGAEKLNINKNGELEITTPLGVIKEKAPVAYQDGKTINSKWQLINNELRFSVPSYNHNKLLIIDPIVRLWGTYYGGAGEEHIRDITTDAGNNSYVTGYSGSTTAGTIIATTGAYQTAFAGGTFDAFIAKFNSTGARQWATFYGGSGDDYGYANTIDGNTTPNVYLVGATSSTGAIATAGSHQSTSSGQMEAFAVQFNSSTGARQWATYYGDTSNEYAFDCATDGSNNIIIVGSTGSPLTGTTKIASTGAHQTTFAGGTTDGFIAKFNSMGVRQWGTFFGGAATAGDQLRGCDVNKTTNEIAVVGYTGPGVATAMVSAGSYQPASGGAQEAVIAKFNTSGVRQWGTYYGNSGADICQSCSINSLGEVYALGTCYVGGGHGSTGSHQTTYGGGTTDAFLVKLSANGTSRLWGTYYGGALADEGMACKIDNSGNIYISGNTLSTTNISSPNNHQTVFGGGTIDDAFIAGFDASGVRIFGSYYGGTLEDLGYSCTIDALGNMYLVGSSKTTTAGIMASNSSHQVSYGGGNFDGFIAKFISCASLSLTIVGSPTICAGSTTTLSASGTGFTTYTWSSGQTTNSITVSPAINTTYTLTAGTATAGCVYTDIQTVTVTANPTVNISASSTSVCSGSSTTLTASGASTYTWNTGATTAATSISPSFTTIYTATGTASSGCKDTQTISISVSANPTVNIAASSSSMCAGASNTLTASGASSYNWSTGATSATISISPSLTTVYTATGTAISGCSDTQTVSISVSANPTVNIAASSSSVCAGASATLTASGASSYTWNTGSTSATTSISPVLTTTYTVIGTNTLNCSSTKTISIFVNSLPSVSLTTSSSVTCVNNNVNLIGSPSGGVFSGTNVTGANFNSPTAGTFTTTYTYTNSTTTCTNSATKTVTVSLCTGIDNLQNDTPSINIYPNPNNGEFSISIPIKGTYSIVNAIGQMVTQIEIHEDDQVLKINHLSQGVYYLVGKSTKAKIIVTK